MRLVSAVYSAFNGPSDVTVVESDTAVLKCSAGAGVTITFSAWLDEDGAFATVGGLIKTTGKYSNFELVNADTANGQMDLRITNTQLDDQGTYTCQFNVDPSISAMLTVEAQVTSVTLTVNGASVDVMVDEELKLVCTAYGARPRVGIDWTNNGVIVSGDTETESINGDATDTTSTLLYTPSTNDNGHEFQCVTTGQQAATPQSQSVTLNVQFVPVDAVVEYSQGTITCSSVANPTVANNQYVIIPNDTETSIGKTYSYDPESNGCTTVKCEATNAIGTGTGSLAEPLCPVPSCVCASTGVGAIIGALLGAIVIGAAAVIIVVVVFLRPRYHHRSTQRKNNDILDAADGHHELSSEPQRNRPTPHVTPYKNDRTDGADGQAKTGLLQELDLMKKVGSHPHVVNLLGYCTEKEPIYVIVEYLSKGDLKNVLVECRSQDTGTGYSNIHGMSKSLSKTLVRFARDVASGMAFLSSQKCIHRDLAARNVLVSEDMVCKVADFGLSRDVMNVRIYQRESEGLLPMRWMALESLLDDVYTTESDVWSFGILIWEIVTLGARPYPSMTAKTMVAKLKEGYRMPKPKHCKKELYTMMTSCWLQNSNKRPTFRSLFKQLDKNLTSEAEYFSLGDLGGNIYEVTKIKDDKEKL